MSTSDYWSLAPTIWAENRRIRQKKRLIAERSATDPFTAAHIQPMLQAQEGRCYYCGEMLQTPGLSDQVHRDHMLPISKGGAHDVVNIVLACRTCNCDKGCHTSTTYSRLVERQLRSEQLKIVRRIQQSVNRWKAKRVHRLGFVD
jgi:5-methylcytosine-specific restriction endonuclease McrA